MLSRGRVLYSSSHNRRFTQYLDREEDSIISSYEDRWSMDSVKAAIHMQFDSSGYSRLQDLFIVSFVT